MVAMHVRLALCLFASKIQTPGVAALPAQDSSHVSLVSFMIRSDGFDHFRCDRAQSLGINMASMAKVLKCSNVNDAITLKAEDSGDKLTFMFENESTPLIISLFHAAAVFLFKLPPINRALAFLLLFVQRPTSSPSSSSS